MALPSSNRLSSRQDFHAVFRAGIRLSSPHLTMRALRQSENTKTPDAQKLATNLPLVAYLTPARIGISISKKVSKRAVVRNRIRRQIQAAFRCLLPRISNGWRLVVVVQPTAAQECDYHQFLQELEQLLAKAEVLNGHS